MCLSNSAKCFKELHDGYFNVGHDVLLKESVLLLEVNESLVILFSSLLERLVVFKEWMILLLNGLITSTQEPFGLQPHVCINKDHEYVSWETTIVKVSTSDEVDLLCLIICQWLILLNLN